MFSKPPVPHGGHSSSGRQHVQQSSSGMAPPGLGGPIFELSPEKKPPTSGLEPAPPGPPGKSREGSHSRSHSSGHIDTKLEHGLQQHPQEFKCYKLVLDPDIHKLPKVIQYDGANLPQPTDPRNREKKPRSHFDILYASSKMEG